MIATRNKIFKLAGVAFACAVIAACTADVSNPPPLNSGTASAGNADFTKYVAIGDSLTAGYADGALYLLGQQNSFPLMLSQQFSAVGGGAFNQPLMADPADPVAAAEGNLGGMLVGGMALPDFGNRFILNTETQTPERLEGASTIEATASGLNGTAFTNMGVPGAKSFHLVLSAPAPGYGNLNNLATEEANPYFVRFVSDNTVDDITVIGEAATQQPSFVTLWIGNNDILSFATAGGAGIDQLGNVDPSTYGSNDITDPTVFANTYAGLVVALKTANADVKGVLVNIPDVSTIPYFTTVPYNAVPLEQADADALNAAYADYNGGLDVALSMGFNDITAEEVAQRKITFAPGQNTMVIIDEYLTDISDLDVNLVNMRQTTANDLVVLLASSVIETGGGTQVPLGDADVLVPQELTIINNARTAFNTTIKDAADADANLVFLDAAAIMTQLSESGINYGNGSITADFATGGGFSLDGVHPTARGYAVIANSIIDVINTGFDANVYKVDPATYPTVFLK